MPHGIHSRERECPERGTFNFVQREGAPARIAKILFKLKSAAREGLGMSTVPNS